MHSDLSNFANVVLKLNPESTLSLEKNKHGSSSGLCVDGTVIYYILPSLPSQLRRSVRGTVIRVPSLYRCDYFFDRDRYR